jgi:nitrogen fixation NifU-like protein
MADESIYQDRILEHAKADRHYGEPARALARRTGVNPLCGDEVTLFFAGDGALQVLQFVCKGCALCRASASLLIEAALARPRAEWRDLAPEAALEEVAARFPSRTRCVKLPWETFAQLLDDLAQEKP